jgi:cardiolipin synthase
LRRRARTSLATPPATTGKAGARFVTRDNRHHTTDIEREYRHAIRAAKKRIVIANAYFFPGYRVIRDMRQASKRGVDVRLILQGKPDMPIVQKAASMLYHHLLHAGVHIYEYIDRPLHGKVALVDHEWSTVGSSNLDPLSLSLNLEANFFIRDADFNAGLCARLDHLMNNSCRRIEAEQLEHEWSGWRLVRSFFVFHALRWYPSLAGWLPNPRKQAFTVGLPITRNAVKQAGKDHGQGTTRTETA